MIIKSKIIKGVDYRKIFGDTYNTTYASEIDLPNFFSGEEYSDQHHISIKTIEHVSAKYEISANNPNESDPRFILATAKSDRDNFVTKYLFKVAFEVNKNQKAS